MKNTTNGSVADGYAHLKTRLDGYSKEETAIVPHLLDWDFRQEFIKSCGNNGLPKVNQNLKNLTLVFINKVNALLALVMSEKVSPPAFFWAAKRIAAECDGICTDATMTGIVNDDRFTETEKRNLLELMCGDKFQRGDKIWTLRNKS